MDIPTILTRKFQGSLWELHGDDYTGLNWQSDTPKPSKEELENLWPTVQAELQYEAQVKIEAKASAIAKLSKLGLTLDEIEALKS
jgi:hypothetical protein